MWEMKGRGHDRVRVWGRSYTHAAVYANLKAKSGSQRKQEVKTKSVSLTEQTVECTRFCFAVFVQQDSEVESLFLRSL